MNCRYEEQQQPTSLLSVDNDMLAASLRWTFCVFVHFLNKANVSLKLHVCRFVQYSEDIFASNASPWRNMSQKEPKSFFSFFSIRMVTDSKKVDDATGDTCSGSIRLFLDFATGL